MNEVDETSISSVELVSEMEDNSDIINVLDKGLCKTC